MKYQVNKANTERYKKSSIPSMQRLLNDDIKKRKRDMKDLNDELRKSKKDVFINLSTGTWSSPFWLLHSDTVWRRGHDHYFVSSTTSPLFQQASASCLLLIL